MPRKCCKGIHLQSFQEKIFSYRFQWDMGKSFSVFPGHLISLTKSVSFDNNCYKSIDGILYIDIYFTSLNYIPMRYTFCIEFPQTHFFGSGAASRTRFS